jgi:monofunctional biosynthetic peptidoglycan transglycosylase
MSSSMKFLFKWTFILLLIALAAVGIYLADQPDVKALAKTNPTTTSLMQLRIEQAKKTNKPFTTQMIWKNLDEISPNLIHAVLLAEDDMFYQHQGFDFKEIKEAIRINWEKKRYAYGGSTITQQLARNLYLSPKKNLLRKLKEAIITYRLEKALPKKRILEIYLNVIEWGRGVYGAEAASLFYFQVPASDLSADEAVALASVLPSPRRWSPVSEKGFMARRRTQLMNRMQRAGYAPVYTDDMEVPFTSEMLNGEEAPSNPDGLQGLDFHAAPAQPE